MNKTINIIVWNSKLQSIRYDKVISESDKWKWEQYFLVGTIKFVIFVSWFNECTIVLLTYFTTILYVLTYYYVGSSKNINGDILIYRSKRPWIKMLIYDPNSTNQNVPLLI